MSEAQQSAFCPLNRRAFLRGGSLFLLGATAAWNRPLESVAEELGNAKPDLRIGLLTDLHYADREPADIRYYRETLIKCAEAAARFQAEKTDLVVSLGDTIDAADTLEGEKNYLRQVVRELAAAPGQHHFVLGNHCVYSLSKAEYLEIVGQKSSYYSFDHAGQHFVLLDACFRSDGTPYGRKNYRWTDSNIPAAELDWLKADLAQTSLPTTVFVHQRLDAASPYGANNAPQVREILEASKKVVAVLQGHHHRGDYQQIAGIHYCTLKALVEGAGVANNAFALLDYLPGGALRLTGFRRQPSHHWPAAGV